MIRYCPVLSWDTAQAAPYPEKAWIGRPEKETESMYLYEKDGHILYRDGLPIINKNNYCMRVEYDTFRMRTKQNGLGHPLDVDLLRRWTEEMIRKYDPNMWAFIQLVPLFRQGMLK